jgi:hypothetical protein
MEICEISARAFGSYYRKGETTGILRWDPVEKQLKINSIHVSTEIAIRNKKEEDKRELHEVVPKEYHHLLDVFEKEEKTGLPPHRAGIDLEINLEPGKEVPLKKIYPLGQDELEELHRYIQQNEKRGWIRETMVTRAAPILFVKKKDGKLRLCVDYRGLNEITKKDQISTTADQRSPRQTRRSKILHQVDIKDAYHNIRIRAGDEWKTAFSSKLGTYVTALPEVTILQWVTVLPLTKDVV